MISQKIAEQVQNLLVVHLNQLALEYGSRQKIDPTRIQVWADVDKYNKKEDESVWEQDKEKTKHVYAVEFDGRHMLTFTEQNTEQQVLQEFWEEFLRRYKLDKYDEGKVFLFLDSYKKAAQEKIMKDEADRQEKLKKIDKAPLVNDSAKIAKQAAKDLITDATTT